MKIPEHDIIDVKWLLARASYAAKPREEEARSAAAEIFRELIELNGLHGISISEVGGELQVAVPGGATSVVRYEGSGFMITRGSRQERAPVAYDAGLRSFVGPEITDALPGRNGSRPRVPALVALMRAALGDAAEVGAVVARPISLRGG